MSKYPVIIESQTDLLVKCDKCQYVQKLSMGGADPSPCRRCGHLYGTYA